MRLTEEKGITLLTLVITIIVLLILVSIGTTSGISTIKSAKFTQFKAELQILQTKVNELNQYKEINKNSEIDIGTELNQTQKNILNQKIISEIIYKNVLSNEEIAKIQEGFRYCDVTEIQSKLELSNIKRDYLINIEYRYVISCNGVEFNGITYYMVDQIDQGIYNVRFNDKNDKPDKDETEIGFNLTSIQENDRWRIEVSDIQFNQFINNWQVQYRLETESYWKDANSLIFYVTQSGNYYVQLVHNEKILGPKRVELIE